MIPRIKEGGNMLRIEHKGLKEFQDTLTYLEKNFPKESKQMIRKVGNKVRVIVRKKARQLVERRTGNYYDSIKRGKVFMSGSKELTVRVYSSGKAPHSHLIERGHRIVTKDGQEVGFQDGYYVFDKVKNEVESQFDKIIETELDKIFRKL